MNLVPFTESTHCSSPPVSRSLRNSEIQFEIEISETEPCRTEQFLEFRKVGNSEKSRSMEGCQQDWCKSNNAGRLQHLHFTMFRYADDANDLDSEPIVNRSTEFNEFRTEPIPN